MELTTNQKPINLTGTQRQQFREALIDAFPRKNDFKIILSEDLGVELDVIVGGDNYQEIVFEVIKWFQAQGRLNELLEAAKRRNFGNSKLKELNFLENETEDTNQLNKEPKEFIKKTKADASENYSDQNLQIALWKLNHSQQVDKFLELSLIIKTIKFRIQISSKKTPNSRIAGFWLLKSLINSLNLDDIICANLSLVDTFKYKGKPQDILDGISDQLKLGCEPGTHVEKIIEKICKKMLQEKQHILLLFCGVDFQTKSTLDKILKDFWLRLTEEVQKAKINHYLLMCWIDCKNKIDWRTSYEFLDDPKKYIESKNPETLFDIGVTPKFGKEDLKRWLKEHDGRTAILKLNANLVKEEQRNKTIEHFWTESRGEPEKLLKEIYTSCKLCWEDYEDKWQKFR